MRLGREGAPHGDSHVVACDTSDGIAGLSIRVEMSRWCNPIEPFMGQARLGSV